MNFTSQHIAILEGEIPTIPLKEILISLMDNGNIPINVITDVNNELYKTISSSLTEEFSLKYLIIVVNYFKIEEV